MHDTDASGPLLGAITSFLGEALALLKSCYGTPQLVEYPLPSAYQRQGQEIFGPAGWRTWQRGNDSSCSWKALSSLPSYNGLLKAIESAPWAARHFGQLVGSVMSAGLIELRVVLEHDLLDSVIVRAGSFDVPSTLLEEAAEKLVAFLAEKHIEHRFIVPLLGYESSVSDVELDDDWHVRALSDEELSLLLSMNALPVTFGPPGHVLVPRSWQYGLVKVAVLPKVFGDERGSAAPMQWPNVDGESELLVTALRLIVGGSARAAGAVILNIPKFPSSGWGGSRTIRVVPTDARAPSSVLHANNVEPLRTVLRQLRSEPVLRDKSVSLALRRFRDAVQRPLVDDELLDLMIAAEAIFLQDLGRPVDRGELRFRIAMRAALLLDGTIAPAAQVMRFFRSAYDARSALVHGGTPDKPRGLNGEEVTLGELVATLEGLMREALGRMLTLRAETPSGPWYEWDKGFGDLLDQRPL